MEEMSQSVELTQGLAANVAGVKPNMYTATLGGLTEVAAVAYGNGVGEGVKGGKGHIGMLNGKVIKFNVSAKEYAHKTDKIYSQMMESSNNLRLVIVDLASRVEGYSDGAGSYGTDRLGPKTKEDRIAYRDMLLKLYDILGIEHRNDGEMVGGRKDDLGQYILKKGEGLLTRKAAAKAVTLIRDFMRKTTRTYSKSQLALLNEAEPGKVQNHDLNIWRRVKAMGGLSSHGARDGFAKALEAQRRGGIMDADRSAARAHILEAGNLECGRFEYPSIYAGSFADRNVSVSFNGQSVANVSRGEADKILYFQHARSLCDSLGVMIRAASNRLDLPLNWSEPNLRATLEDALRKVGAFPADGNMDSIKNRLTAEQYRVVLYELRSALLPYVLEQPTTDDTSGKTAWREVIRALAEKLDTEAYSPPQYVANGKFEFYHKNQFAESLWSILDVGKGTPMAASDRAIHLKPLTVKADYRTKDLGAKNSAKYQVSLGDNVQTLNRSAVFDKIQQHCQGQSTGYAFAYVLKLFSEKAKVLKDAAPADKEAYLALLAELKTHLETYLETVNGRLHVSNPNAPEKKWKDIYAADLYDELAAKIDIHAANMNEELRNELKRALSTVKVRYENNRWAIIHNKPSFEVKLRTDYQPKELGAKTSAKYQQQGQGAVVFNAEALQTKIRRDCRGMDFRQAYGLALETFTEKSPSFRQATALQKSEYLLALKQLKANLGNVDVDKLTANAAFDQLKAIVEASGIEMGEELAKGLKDTLQAVKDCYGDRQVLPSR